MRHFLSATSFIGLAVLTGSTMSGLPEPSEKRGLVVKSVHCDAPGMPSISFGTDMLIGIDGVGGNTFSLWNTSNGKLVRTFVGHKSYIREIRLSEDCKYAVSGGGVANLAYETRPRDNTIRLWNVATGKAVRSFQGHQYPIHNVQISPDNRRVLSSDQDTVRMWEVLSGNEIFFERYQPVPVAVCNPNWSLLLVQNRWKADIHDARTGEFLAALLIQPGDSVNSGSFDPTGSVVITAHGNHSVRTWDARTGMLIRIYDGHTDSVTDAISAPDGSRIVSCSEDGTVRIWSTKSGNEIGRLTHQGSVDAMLLSGDGKRLYTMWTSLQGRIERKGTLWNLDSRERILDSFEILGFSADGRRLLTRHGIEDLSNQMPVTWLSAEDGKAMKSDRKQ
jgi:WD40 repeat protein